MSNNPIINKGLVSLAETARSISNGNISNIPKIYRDAVLSVGNESIRDVAISIEQSGNEVLRAVGINIHDAYQLGISTGTIATIAMNTAQDVFKSVVSGSFGLDDFTGVSGAFENLFDILTNSNNVTSGILNPRTPSPFAVDKSRAEIHPKFKFLFVAEFIFNDDFNETLTENSNHMAFLVKTASRPNIHIEYEDINMYNFKTKVPKNTEYQPITMSFFDDQSNQTTSFYKKYSELLIPNMGIPEGSEHEYESSSFNFTQNRDTSPYNSSSLQSLPGDSGHKNIIKSIRLFHIWGWGKYVNVYKYINPKVTEINVSDLDMESNELCEIEIQFSYDGLNIQTTTDDDKNISLDPKSENGGNYDVLKYSSPYDKAEFPLTYNGASNNLATETIEKFGHGFNSGLTDKLKKHSLDLIEDTFGNIVPTELINSSINTLTSNAIITTKENNQAFDGTFSQGKESDFR